MAYLDGQPVTVIGVHKGKDLKECMHRNYGMPSPEGYRKALRLMKQAEKFKRPVITLSLIHIYREKEKKHVREDETDHCGAVKRTGV